MRRLYIFSLLAFFLFLSNTSWAQQRPALSTYTYSMMTINPAYSGYYGVTDVSLGAGSSIPHVDGAPQYINATVNGLLPGYRKNMGLGGGLAYDKIGVTSTTDVYVSYAYKLISQNKNSYTSNGFYPKVLSFGLQAGFSNVREDLLSLGMYDDPNFASNINETVPYFGVGLFFSCRNFYLGISSPRLYHSFFSEGDLNMQNHYYLQGGYKTALNHKTFLKTALLVRNVEGAPMQFDTNAIVEFNNLFEIGAGYQTAKGLNFTTALHLGKSMRLVYYFDLGLNENQPEELNNTSGILLSIRPAGGFKHN
ncbi:PorP/SprF family type IX secretion system membrane protein [Fulvivirga maritima]|uniref:PorP/SprF family type IX secretion system membrane protein n=1 Tax=Fulvivirga maritima TaxID=2904247 RepID=UPI001F33BB14|nr:PorP/SprF family type IX secretion system membrane protein [Fulvivirga maritima]UII25873.1 PorP/SprF family type IX secretion system membrane protein [Fulvivirga maritima]